MQYLSATLQSTQDVVALLVRRPCGAQSKMHLAAGKSLLMLHCLSATKLTKYARAVKSDKIRAMQEYWAGHGHWQPQGSVRPDTQGWKAHPHRENHAPAGSLHREVASQRDSVGRTDQHVPESLSCSAPGVATVKGNALVSRACTCHVSGQGLENLNFPYPFFYLLLSVLKNKSFTLFEDGLYYLSFFLV